MCERQKREREESNNTKREGRGGPSRVLLRELSVLGFDISEIFFWAGSPCVGFF